MSTHYRPHWTLRPLVWVRWRNVPHGSYPPGVEKLTWRVFLFGRFAIASFARRAG